MTLAALETYRDALKAALYSGELVIHSGDRTITYRSVPELRAALAAVEADIAAQSSTSPIRCGRIVPARR